MALAQKVSTYDYIAGGSAARALPEVERAPRSATRPVRAPKHTRRLMVMGAFSWLCIMGFSLALIHINTLVLEETTAITQTREELARLDQQNQELASLVIGAVSVSEVEKWALAHGMKRPTTVMSLGALMPQSASLQAEPTQVEPVSAGLWGSVRGYMSKVVHLVGAPSHR
jgi:hypothetical protein